MRIRPANHVDLPKPVFAYSTCLLGTMNASCSGVEFMTCTLAIRQDLNQILYTLACTPRGYLCTLAEE